MTKLLTHPAAAALPVLQVVPEVARALGEAGGAVLVAPPGAGKTTAVPLALLGEEWLGEGRVLMLEPRRLAARAAASRMATLLGEPGPGGRIGYRMRGETVAGPKTRVEVVTEGVLTRMLQSDPSLAGVGLVVFDEFHERSLHADLGLALTLHARSLLRQDLRVLVMSATLDASPVAALLGGVPVVSSDGRVHPVETRWRRQPATDRVEAAAATTVIGALARDEGDVLVFLPGAGEIRRVAQRLAVAGVGEFGSAAGAGRPGRAAAHVAVVPLHGGLGRADQDAAIAPSPPGRRKVVLATSIAETSLTIEGVRVVVDAGLMRVPRFHPGTGMSRLETVRVTRDAADQRRGRAGRVAAGVCYRLWTRAEDRGLVPHRRPEILDADLAGVALDLAAWGASPAELAWLDPPPATAFAQATELLRDLDVLDDDGRVTDHGRAVARLGLHPRLGHMLIRAAAPGPGRTDVAGNLAGGLAADLAALLSERDPLRAEGRAPDADLRLRLELLRSPGAPGVVGAHVAPGGVAGQWVDRAALTRVRHEAGRLRRLVARVGRATGRAVDRRAARGAGPGRPAVPGRPAAPGRPGTPAPSGRSADLDAVGVLAALAYPDRIGQRRPGERGRFLLCSGRGARFAEPQPLEGADWLVAVDVEDRGAEGRIFRAAALDLADIEAHFGARIRDVEEVFWDADAGRVVARLRRTLDALTLGEAPLERPDPGAVGAALLGGIRAAGLGVLPWSPETRQLRGRIQFLHRLDPDAWPEATETSLATSLEDWLLPFLPGLRRLSDLRQVDLAAALLARLPPGGRGRLDALAPAQLEVPSGSRLRIDYSDPDTPTLAVRLQEVFGLTQTPTLAGGRVPLTLQLLSPAQRPVQVTRDLASFWRDAYFEVRRELRGRYPKHAWPEDPLRAEPTRRTRRRE